MSERPQLDLAPRHLELVRAILSQWVPEHEVWAYGSRARGEAFEASDLDLVVRDPADLLRPCAQLPRLRAAFVACDLPIRVDVVDWARVSEAFRGEIAAGYVPVAAAAGTRG